MLQKLPWRNHGTLTRHWLTVVTKGEGLFFILTNVYGYDTDNQNKVMLEEITVLELKGRYSE